MNRSSRHNVLQLICLSAAALGASSGALAQAVEYALTELPPLPGHVQPGVLGINSSGMAVGSDSDGIETSFPILWQGSRAELLPGLGGTGGIGGTAFRINRSGQIAGFVTAKDGARHAVVWSSPANVTDLNTAKGESRALGINDNGQVVGFQAPTVDSDPNFSAIATLWNGKTPVALPIPPISQTPPASEAEGINDSGVIVGTIFGGTLNGGNVGARWDGSWVIQLNDLGDVGGGRPMALPGDINNSGVIVGAAGTPTMDSQGFFILHAALWRGTNPNPTDLGSLLGPTGNSFAFQINSAGQIVGASDSADGLGHAVLWQDGKILDLNTLARSALPKNVVLTTASAVSDSGQIGVEAINTVSKQNLAFLLTPRYSTTTTLVASQNPIVFGQKVTFTASVQGNGGGAVTGTVVFSDGAAKLGAVTLNSAQKAFFATSALAAGHHNITAAYQASGPHLGSASAVLKESVTPAATRTSLHSSLNPSKRGQLVTLTATVTPAVAGDVTGVVVFKDGALSLGHGSLNNAHQARLSIATLVKGTHNIIASYGGSANDSVSSSTALKQVVK